MSDQVISLMEIAGRDATLVRFRDLEIGSTREAALASLERRLLQIPAEISTRRLILDINSVEVFGAAFLGILVRLYTSLRGCKRELLLVRCKSELIALTRLDAIMPVFPSTSTALKSPVRRECWGPSPVIDRGCITLAGRYC